jgi:hypothetical protein
LSERVAITFTIPTMDPFLFQYKKLLPVLHPSKSRHFPENYPGFSQVSSKNY